MNKKIINKEWLEQKYIKEKLPPVNIASMAGCSSSCIVKYIKKYNIPYRNRSESAKIKIIKSKYKELNDYEYLYDNHINKKLTTVKISEQIGCTQRLVYNALKKHKIKIRNKREAAQLRPYSSGFHQLNDTEWINQKYNIEKLSCTEIANLLGTSEPNVWATLKRRGIKIRNVSETILNFRKDSIAYKCLNDKSSLNDLYINKHMSIADICQFLNVKSQQTIINALIKNDIKIRSLSDAAIINRENDGFIFNLPVIEGSLLGDASLIITDVLPKFIKANKFMDHVLFVSSLLYEFNHENKVYPIKTTVNGFAKKSSIFWRLDTRVQPEFIVLYERWYPQWNNYKKVIPNDLILTKDTLLHWFLDDGYSVHIKKKKYKSVCIRLCTDCFSLESQNLLCEKIYNEFGIKATTRKRKNGNNITNRIFISEPQHKDFFNLIGPPPVPSLAYKWK